MKTYKIINTDILFKGKLFPENSTINLDDKDAQSLSSFLKEIKDASTSNSYKELKNNKRKK